MSEDNFENIETIIEDAPDIAPGANGKAEEKVPSKQADILIRLARAATLFHTPDGDAVADIKIDVDRAFVAGDPNVDRQFPSTELGYGGDRIDSHLHGVVAATTPSHLEEPMPQPFPKPRAAH